MADPDHCPPLTRQSVREAHHRIHPYIYRTPVATCTTLDRLASTSQAERFGGDHDPGAHDLSDVSPYPDHEASDLRGSTAAPKIRLFFKCENQQRIGAFKARGAFHALGRLIEERGLEAVRRTGVVTHSSGNHAQALALAAKSFQIPAHIVMPTISTPSKIAGTRQQGARVIFSGSTSDEREAVVADVIRETGATLVPPYDHPDVILGQGTQALEFEEQVAAFLAHEAKHPPGQTLDAVIAPLGANDAERGLREADASPRCASLTIADGVRTPVGAIPWSVIADPEQMAGVYSVTEEQIKAALRLLMERAKLFVEPTAALGLAVVLYNEAFRREVQRRAGGKGWNVGVILSGGNTTMEALAKLFTKPEPSLERAGATLGTDGGRTAENVAG
ncbi:serine racemase-like [Teratosphaeria destructans]|uniref:Serine racemase-like n=1 Tax=Teratosphaeria destructans TaxID=418781 RepID=A0A9W7SJ13_9PEZI|nr:serine racemase-like [Teratosphaeria destructans]